MLLVAGIRKKDATHCKDVAINIIGAGNNFFVDQSDITNVLMTITQGTPVGRPTGSLNLKMMESQLEKSTWVKDAEIFIDNNEVLQVTVHEREPVARVFTTAGSTFYIDDEIMILPLSEKFSARLPVFSNFPLGSRGITKADSSLLIDIKMISLAIQKDSFLMAMIEQVDITPLRNFEMIPKLGNQVIVFGDASAIDEKFNKLKLFYQKIMMQAGWNNYSVINVQYKNQVVARRRGAEDFTADSLRTLQLMQIIAANAERQSDDSLQNNLPENKDNIIDSSMIQKSIQRDENTDNTSVPADQQPTTQPINKPVLKSSPPKKIIKK